MSEEQTQEAVKKHPAELLSEELAMGTDHPSYYRYERRKKPRTETEN